MRTKDQDYKDQLTKHNFDFVTQSYHYMVGTSKVEKGWILHISAIVSQVNEMLEHVLPILKYEKVPFKIIGSSKAIKAIQYGEGGKEQIGKVLTIYTENNQHAAYLIEKLIHATERIKGPSVLTDVWLGGSVYARYGIYNPSYTFNSAGERVRAIMRKDGKIETDEYTIPYSLKPELEWPFDAIRPFNTTSIESNKLGNYEIIDIIKESPKGRVMKAKLFQSTCNKQFVIKEGIKHMWSDEAGRDMVDRLHWQSELHTKYKNASFLPEFIDFFILNQNGYLVLEEINGMPLLEARKIANPDMISWKYLSPTYKRLLIDIAMQVVLIIKTLHQDGLIHRDLSPENFLVEPSGKVRAIDVEMAYSVSERKPKTPFEFGTAGYSYPLDPDTLPSFKDDIFGIGALLLHLFTGIPPTMYRRSDLDRYKTLTHFMGESQISKILNACMSDSLDKRPGIDEIIATIYSVNERSESIVSTDQKEEIEIEYTIQKGINGLIEHPIEMGAGLWLSYGSERGNNKSIMHHSFTVKDGIPGAILTLLLGKENGFDVTGCAEILNNSFSFLQTRYLAFFPFLPSGLFEGSHGVSYILLKAMSSGIKPFDIGEISKLKKILSADSKSPTLSSGTAGQGIAIIETKSYWKEDEFHIILTQALNTLKTQMIDYGTWVQMEMDDGRIRYSSSFQYGNSGIIYFLLKYYKIAPTVEVLELIQKGLTELQKEAEILASEILAIGLAKFNEIPLATEGIIGIAATSLLAYEIFNRKEYLNTALEILETRPPTEVHSNFNLDQGLSGLGIIYLQTYKITEDRKWLERAEWISNSFINTSLDGENGGIYWQYHQGKKPTAELFAGSCSVLVFLYNYVSLKKKTSSNTLNKQKKNCNSDIEGPVPLKTGGNLLKP